MVNLEDAKREIKEFLELPTGGYEQWESSIVDVVKSDEDWLFTIKEIDTNGNENVFDLFVTPDNRIINENDEDLIEGFKERFYADPDNLRLYLEFEARWLNTDSKSIEEQLERAKAYYEEDIEKENERLLEEEKIYKMSKDEIKEELYKMNLNPDEINGMNLSDSREYLLDMKNH